MFRIFLIVLAILIPLTIIFVQWQAGKYKEFLKTAKEVDGQVIRAENQVFDRKNNRKEFIINYEFVVDGAAFEGEERLEYPDMEDKFTLCSRVAILYDPTNPHKSHLKLLLMRRLGRG